MQSVCTKNILIRDILNATSLEKASALSCTFWSSGWWDLGMVCNYTAYPSYPFGSLQAQPGFYWRNPVPSSFCKLRHAHAGSRKPSICFFHMSKASLNGTERGTLRTASLCVLLHQVGQFWPFSLWHHGKAQALFYSLSLSFTSVTATW